MSCVVRETVTETYGGVLVADDYHYHCSKCNGRLHYFDESGKKIHCDCTESVRDTEIMLCDHRNFHTSVDVSRLEDLAAFHADIRIHCIDCGMKFVFIGCHGGFDMSRPMVSFGGDELRIPIEPISPIVRRRPEKASG